MSGQPSSLTITIPCPHDDHHRPTDREWVQPVLEAMLAGARAWMLGADLICVPNVEVSQETVVAGGVEANKEGT